MQFFILKPLLTHVELEWGFLKVIQFFPFTKTNISNFHFDLSIDNLHVNLTWLIWL